ncbi:uncharacterized protein B0I36DRAFT_350516 [Microdochium trichocladiopsis]|uniref:Uncharacterized protein n=1 Tax=Microdochium trichocladiopsis TaxID=1682393 RepID=A0A9P8Y505_9PEZI|nr:uncharacterized protein B0I36DRAFT_350516 [Microdochium trichocladiopsis]KAH7029687.1 hypothetical protein B0I36DRAFT_350516 [Microdochium trichocladiopsis]
MTDLIDVCDELYESGSIFGAIDLNIPFLAKFSNWTDFESYILARKHRATGLILGLCAMPDLFLDCASQPACTADALQGESLFSGSLWADYHPAWEFYGTLGCQCTEKSLRGCSDISEILQEGYFLGQSGEIRALWRDECPLHKALFVRKTLLRVQRKTESLDEEQSLAWFRHIIRGRSYFMQRGEHESWLELVRKWWLTIAEEVSHTPHLSSSLTTQAVQAATEIEGPAFKEAYYHLLDWLSRWQVHGGGVPSDYENLTARDFACHLEDRSFFFDHLCYRSESEISPPQASEFGNAEMPWEVRLLLGLPLIPIKNLD